MSTVSKVAPRMVTLSQLQPYIAVVTQPSCANVFFVNEIGSRVRLVQSSREYCAAFAAGYLSAQKVGDGYCRKYRCESGDAKVQSWEVDSDD